MKYAEFSKILSRVVVKFFILFRKRGGKHDKLIFFFLVRMWSGIMPFVWDLILKPQMRVPGYAQGKLVEDVYL